MSSIKLSPNASGTGEFTIAAPNSNTNRTLTLPDQTGTVVTTSADALNIGSGQLVKDASGNVGIGTSSPARRLEVRGADAAARFRGSSTQYLDVTATAGGTVNLDANNGDLAFSVNTVERARIDNSGNFLFGVTADPSGSGNNGASFFKTANNYELHSRSGVTTISYVGIFYNSNGTVGSISTNGSATTYSTSSDYRLKHDIAPMTGALAKVAALKPCTYKWNADDREGEGFIAHELAEVCPQAVVGEKDAVNEDGSIKPQGIDTSFLVATLTAALQELNAKVQALEARLASDGPFNGGATQ